MTAPVRPALRGALAIGGGLLGLAALAGCAPTASGSTAPADSSGGSSAAAPAASAASADLKDGTYTAPGDYQSPAGPSDVEVTVTLKDSTITAVKVVPKTPDATAQQYERQFASGIDAVAVGKPIAGLQVGAVSGSSLTSQGFEKALETIRSKAAA